MLVKKEKEAQKVLNQVLKNSISYFDNYENFYHGFLVGFLNADGYTVKSDVYKRQIIMMIKIFRKGKKIMKRISTGIENFKELLDNNYYYVDKTKLIEDVLSDKVMLYTRPRRFGKTLNMSMLYYFFSNKEKENAYLFDGLYISKQQEAKSYQNQYPVIFLSLKDMQSLNMEEQKRCV